MTGNLMDLINDLKHKNSGGGPALADRCMEYDRALHAYWAKDYDKSLDIITSLLVEEPDGEHLFAGYRLWIELLAATGDVASLGALKNHLFIRGQAEPEHQEYFSSLRGITHFEMDEFGAAKLLSSAVEKHFHNPYAMELVQLVTDRLSADHTEVPAILHTSVRIDDYVTFQSLARALVARRSRRALEELTSWLRDTYRSSPLPAEVEFHSCIDSQTFAAASIIAQRLVELHPGNADYHYYLAYSLFEDGNYIAAKNVLEKYRPQVSDVDAEFFGLLGHCHAKVGEAKQAAEFLQRAIEILKQEGLPTSHMTLELNEVLEELSAAEGDPVVKMPQEPRSWLINLSTRRYLELATSSESTVERLLRPMGKEPRQGDICFFATTAPVDGEGKSTWKIGAVYEVVSDPIQHPVHNYHNALKLVRRLPDLPLDTIIDDSEARTAPLVNKQDPIYWGVYQLDDKALDAIEETARMHKDEMIERRLRSRRPTA
jgi:tetratricopeptide (TPR) repeat protein